MDEPPGSFQICNVCGWEDDHVQLANPRMRGGANRESLVEAQAAALERFPFETQSADRFERDRSWRPLREDEQRPRADTPRSGEEYFQAAAADSVSYYWKK
jgi:hypothetical protein